MRQPACGAAAFIIVGLAAAALGSCDEPTVEWSGTGEIRLLVRVDPLPIDGRDTDVGPAELEIDLAANLSRLGLNGRRADISTVQVMQYDPRTGKPRPYADYAYQRSRFDRPFRWYDGSIPYSFPEFEEDVSRTQGRIVRNEVLRRGYFFNALGDWDAGRLAWVHTQSGMEPARYAVYLDLLPEGGLASNVPPRAWLGDGMPRCDRTGGSSCGSDHCRIELADVNSDGLVDLVAGESYGHVLWWPNRGTTSKPRFPFCRFLLDAEGQPIDAGMAAAPKVVDWDGDGAWDLLVGTEWNRVLFYKNVGSNAEHKLAYQGFVTIGDQPLVLPVTPLERGSQDVFRRDYYPVLETVDFDDDGDLDLLAGGYITGRIYFFEAVGRDDRNWPLLKLRGAIESDGKPLNVGHWCAAPCLADFDGDGDLDLISGNMPMGASGDGAGERPSFLRFYRNIGDRRVPEFTEQDFPRTGAFPRSGLATPRCFDWDDDGDLDLVVSARDNIYLYENMGTRSDPRWHVPDGPLESIWGNTPISVDQFRDWNGDGRLDLIRGYSVRLNSGNGNPGRWDAHVSVLPPGVHIEHPSHVGDDWFWPYLDDFDGDGRVDVLFGDWFGNVWLHRNQSTATENRFDIEGERLSLESGGDIKVGPIGKDPAKDFDALQGARTVLTTADVDRDGTRDIVVGDTYGRIRYFRNAGSGSHPVFADPVDMGDLGIRLLVERTDWNGDGWTDIVAGAANGRVRVYLNAAGTSERPFLDGFDPELPPIPQPRVLMADLNGDGDDDLFLPSTVGSCLVERTFLKHGYARASLVRAEIREREESPDSSAPASPPDERSHE